MQNACPVYPLLIAALRASCGWLNYNHSNIGCFRRHQDDNALLLALIFPGASLTNYTLMLRVPQALL